jgi:hypothetical protein
LRLGKSINIIGSIHKAKESRGPEDEEKVWEIKKEKNSGSP